MNYIKYKDRNKINIEELKKKQSINLLQYVKENNVDIENVAIDLGINEEKLINILSFPENSKGSELLLISKYFKTLEKNKKNIR